MDQSGVMAGKAAIQTRRSVLGTLNTNNTINISEVRIIYNNLIISFLFIRVILDLMVLEI